MATPVTTIASGGLPVVEVTAFGMAVTEDVRGIAVTKVTGGKPGLPVTFVSATGGPAFTAGTWSLTDKSANIVLSNSNLTAATNNASLGSVRASAGLSSGKRYWEITFVAASAVTTATGLAPASSVLPINYNDAAKDAATLNGLGAIYVDGVQVVGSFGSVTGGTLVCIAVDLDASPRLIWFRLGAVGNWNGNVANNPATGTGGQNINIVTLPACPYFSGGASGNGATANFGASAFSGTVPSGFTAGWPA